MAIRNLPPAYLAEINGWLTRRTALLTPRDVGDILRAVGYLNSTTQWVQTKASDEKLGRITDYLLLAMHDPYSVLVRRTADQRRRQTAKPALAAVPVSRTAPSD